MFMSRADSQPQTSDLLRAFRSLPLSSFASRSPASTTDFQTDPNTLSTLSLLANSRRALLQSQLPGEEGNPGVLPTPEQNVLGGTVLFVKDLSAACANQAEHLQAQL